MTQPTIHPTIHQTIEQFITDKQFTLEEPTIHHITNIDDNDNLTIDTNDLENPEYEPILIHTGPKILCTHNKTTNTITMTKKKHIKIPPHSQPQPNHTDLLDIISEPNNHIITTLLITIKEQTYTAIHHLELSQHDLESNHQPPITIRLLNRTTPPHPPQEPQR